MLKLYTKGKEKAWDKQNNRKDTLHKIYSRHSRMRADRWHKKVNNN